MSQRNAFANDILQERRLAPHWIVQDSRRDHARGNRDPEFEVDIERDVDDSVLECRTFSVGLDDDEDVEIRVRSRVAASLGADETELQQLRAEDLASLLGEAVECALSDWGTRHGCSITSRFSSQSDCLTVTCPVDPARRDNLSYD